LIVGPARAAGSAIEGLRQVGWAAHYARDPAEAVGHLRANGLDLVVLGAEGAAERRRLCAAIRELRGSLPILLLESTASEREELGQPSGADDYVVCAFDAEEICTRVRALLRRAGSGSSSVPSVDETFGPLCLDAQTRSVSFESRSESLTAIEYQLLCRLARAPERVFSRDELLRDVWGYAHAGYAPTLMTHMSRLRTKLERGLGAPRLIHTVRGIGYQFASRSDDGTPDKVLTNPIQRRASDRARVV
jgi:DNA-binding response OmpR family regulator